MTGLKLSLIIATVHNILEADLNQFHTKTKSYILEEQIMSCKQ